MDEFTKDLSRALELASVRAGEWMKQREQLVAEVTRVRDAADGLLGALGAEAKGRGGRPPGKANRTLSEETKRKMREAWKRRKAKSK